MYENHSLSLLKDHYHKLVLLVSSSHEDAAHYTVNCIHELLLETNTFLIGKFCSVLDVLAYVLLVSYHQLKSLKEGNKSIYLSWLEVISIY
jgi:hypothetical protein